MKSKIVIIVLIALLSWFLWIECSKLYEAKKPEFVDIEVFIVDEIPDEIEKVIPEQTEEPTEEPTEEMNEVHFEKVHESIGEFRLTAYCSCEKCCGKWAKNRPKDENGNAIVLGATGEVLKAGRSIAVDPEVIPYGSEVIINGHIYKAQDCGGAINGNSIDVYFDDHQAAVEFGVQYAEVFVEKVNTYGN